MLFLSKNWSNTLQRPKTDGIILDTENTKSLEVFADAEFCVNWNNPTANEDVNTDKWHTCYSIMYAGSLIILASKLQNQITLSTTKTKYMELSKSLWDYIPVMLLLQ